MEMRTGLIIGALAIGLAGCSSSRPEGAICQGNCALPEGPITLFETPKNQEDSKKSESQFGQMADEDFGDQLRALMRYKADLVPKGVPERALADLPRTEEGRLNILALSAGGPFGAFGAGFLNGWSSQTSPDLTRPEAFDMVTGVSTGALLATHAFLGREGDAVLREQYTTISTADVLRERSLFSALFSNALFDTAPLRRTLEALITPKLLDEVAKATDFSDPEKPGRLLLVLAVNLDSGLPQILDLGAIARAKNDPRRRERYIDALMASAAIPVAFPPVFIDGSMHADGGTRLMLFFNRYLDEQRASIEESVVLAPRLDIIINSELTLDQSCTENSLIGIGKRSFRVVLDQISLDSLYRAIVEVERIGGDVRYVTAEGSGCKPPTDAADMFQTEFLQCLFDHGERVGSGQNPWTRGTDDFPGIELSARTSGSPSCPAS